MSDEREEERRIKQQNKEAQDKHRARIVKALIEEGRYSSRELALELGCNKETVVRYKRLAGLSPPPPVRHIGGGRWVSDAPSKPFSKGRRRR